MLTVLECHFHTIVVLQYHSILLEAWRLSTFGSGHVSLLSTILAVGSIANRLGVDAPAHSGSGDACAGSFRTNRTGLHINVG